MLNCPREKWKNRPMDREGPGREGATYTQMAYRVNAVYPNFVNYCLARILI